MIFHPVAQYCREGRWKISDSKRRKNKNAVMSPNRKDAGDIRLPQPFDATPPPFYLPQVQNTAVQGVGCLHGWEMLCSLLTNQTIKLGKLTRSVKFPSVGPPTGRTNTISTV